MPNKHTIEKAQKIQQIVRRYHEPGRQDKNLNWVFMYHVCPVYPMCKRTFWRYLKINATAQKDIEDKNQLTLF